jgi:molybdopterin-guanine dinucleotide biosynthesis protein B
MKVIAVTGRSETGKTSLIRGLIEELGRSGIVVAVVKHCGDDFDLGAEDKDSAIFLKAGAVGVALAAPERTAFIRKTLEYPSDLALASECEGADLVIIEGGRADAFIPKIEVLRKGVSEDLRTPARELKAVVADFEPEMPAPVPVFNPRRFREIAVFIASNARELRAETKADHES